MWDGTLPTSCSSISYHIRAPFQSLLQLIMVWLMVSHYRVMAIGLLLRKFWVPSVILWFNCCFIWCLLSNKSFDVASYSWDCWSFAFQWYWSIAHTCSCPMRLKFLKYWQKIPLLYSFAFILDPRAKIRDFHNVLQLLSQAIGVAYSSYFASLRNDI